MKGYNCCLPQSLFSGMLSMNLESKFYVNSVCNFYVTRTSLGCQLAQWHMLKILPFLECRLVVVETSPELQREVEVANFPVPFRLVALRI